MRADILGRVLIAWAVIAVVLTGAWSILRDWERRRDERPGRLRRRR